MTEGRDTGETVPARSGGVPVVIGQVGAAQDTAPLRSEVAPSGRVLSPAGPEIAANWADLREIAVDRRRMDRNLIITAARADPAHAAFDVLRARTLQAMTARGWRRVGVTSPTKGCGKSFTALNLAISLSRYGQKQVALLDLDLRAPSLARTLGVRAPGSIGNMLQGEIDPLQHLCRFAANPWHIGGNLALGLNNRIEPFAAELFQNTAMGHCLNRIDAALAPDLVLFDLPPALAQDDVIALRPHYDCILMVVGGGRTSPRDLSEAVRRIGEDKPVLGMILNRGRGAGVQDYRY